MRFMVRSIVRIIHLLGFSRTIADTPDSPKVGLLYLPSGLFSG